MKFEKPFAGYGHKQGGGAKLSFRSKNFVLSIKYYSTFIKPTLVVGFVKMPALLSLGILMNNPSTIITAYILARMGKMGAYRT